jgi:nitric oxide reductase NorD protein
VTAFYEFEEVAGSAWHKLVGDRSSFQHFPESQVRLAEMRGGLSLLFHALGGPMGISLAASRAAASRHRLGFLQGLGQSAEKLPQASRTSDHLLLPEQIDLFPERGLNADLYVWLACFFAAAGDPPPTSDDPLAADLAILHFHQRTVHKALAQWPGLRARYARLCAETLRLRPQRQLPPCEQAVEAMIHAMLEAPWQPVSGQPVPAPRGYRPFLPVPLWGLPVAGPPPQARPETDEAAGGSADSGESSRLSGDRRELDQAERKDSLILNRFEKILSLAEMLNLNREVEDDDAESAKKALEDCDQVTLSPHKGRPATKLRFDLDLAPDVLDQGELLGEHLYPEWDFKKQIYHPAYCKVESALASDQGESWQPDEAGWRRIRKVRRQFEALRPKFERQTAQIDGQELDLEALVRAQVDLRSSGAGSDRIHQATRRQLRDLAVTILVDVSLSTDAWIDNRRVLDVEKEALCVLSHGLAACGDDHSILTFTSRKRSWVRVETVKQFGEEVDERVMRRIAALKPGYYTRMGAAIRHAAEQILETPNRHRLIILLTDGKPNDVDHYENRYGVEDSRRAVLEARAQGIALFGVTVDKSGQDYFPMIFGRGGFAIIDHVARLPAALPNLYRQLVG